MILLHLIGVLHNLDFTALDIVDDGLNLRLQIGAHILQRELDVHARGKAQWVIGALFTGF